MTWAEIASKIKRTKRSCKCRFASIMCNRNTPYSPPPQRRDLNDNLVPHPPPQDLGDELALLKATIERNCTIRDGPKDDQREGATTLDGLEPNHLTGSRSLSFMSRPYQMNKGKIWSEEDVSFVLS
jgi:hypothetical protein